MAPTGAENVDAAWALVDQATNEMKARVDALIADINRTAAEGLTGPQTENVLARLGHLGTFLGAVGHNTSQPIPPTPPAEPPMPAPFQ